MNYHELQKKDLILKTRERLMELPSFCLDYIQGIEQNTGERTRLAYATDLKIFFQYLIDNHPQLVGKQIVDLELSDLEKVRATQIEAFLNYVSFYETETEEGASEHQNGEKGKARKLAAIRSMYKYFYRKELIKTDPAMLVSTPKIHDKAIIQLDSEEISELLDVVDGGEKLTERQQKYHQYTRYRDVAIITTLLGTGMRISELVGLDINDVDFKKGALRVIRKGGNEALIYFGDEVELALLDYMDERKKETPLPGHENALFLSMQKKRLSVRSIQILVEKYSLAMSTLKHITPHKLRSTYGTALYNETGDIYLVASVLGHKDVNTTRKHYARMEEERKKEAANIVKLRSDKEPEDNNEE